MVLLAYMPLHIFISTWLGTSFGMLEVARVLKDVVLVAGFGLALAASWGQKWFKDLIKDKLIWLIAGYALLTLLLAAVFKTDQDAEILAVVYNLRFLLFFLYGALLVRLFDQKDVAGKAARVVMAVAVPVLLFGIIQYNLLPNDALTHVGYERNNGVLPVFLIDDKPDLERVMSTLRDPNSLGSYIIIIFAIALAYLLKTNNREVKNMAGGIFGLSLLCLYFTFSRSAWIGALLAAGVALAFNYRSRVNINKKIIAAFAAVAMVGVLSLVSLHNTYFVQNVIFHADESTVLEDPNQLRTRFWKESLEAAAEQPQGYGPGTAGLASIRNDEKVVLNENYYFQILHEVGVLGLVLFLAILVIVAQRLYKLTSDNPIAAALLASFAGLAVTNFLVHIWSNEAVAYTWWGLAGLYVLAGDRRNPRRPRVR